MALGRLLSDPYTFQVPSFQRPFSWTREEASQLLDDVMLALQRRGDGGEAWHFLGHIVLLEPSPSAMSGAAAGAPPRHSIIDGQQRLATVTILLAVLRDVLEERGMVLPHMLDGRVECRPNGRGAKFYRLELRGREASFFERCVQSAGSSRRAPESDDLSDAEGRLLSVREHFATELAERSASDLLGIAEFVAQHCHVAVITTSDIDSAHGIFDVLNNRGRPLGRNDILKAQILGQVDEGARDAALAIWQKAESQLGDVFESLFSHMRVIEGARKSQIISGIQGLLAEVGGAGAFVTQMLEPYAEARHAIREAQHTGSAHSPEINRLLGYLGWFGSSDWVPPALLWWRIHADDPERLVIFLRRLERLAFALRLLGIGADKRATRFQAVVHAIRKGTVLDPRNSPLQIAKDEQRHIIYNLRRLHARSPLTCKLVLLRLNDELAGAPQHLLPNDYTVEHILPQKPSRTSAWRTWFQSAEEREVCTDSIGNLVLVTRKQNERARNAELARKLDVYFRTPAALVPRITAELEGISEWRPTQVLAREERLLSVIKSMWQLDAPRAGEAAPADSRASRKARRGGAPAAPG
jgi:hypothetical protein